MREWPNGKPGWRTGRPKDPEHRAKIAASQKAHYARVREALATMDTLERAGVAVTPVEIPPAGPGAKTSK